VTNLQVALVIGVPVLFNTMITVIVYTLLSQRMMALFTALNQRFDDLRDLWRAELKRGEGLLSARLDHLGERRP
jgi:hypothetical protein